MTTTRHSFSKILLGRPLDTAAAPHQVIGKIPALAVFASDALSSVAYATEEILVILALTGAAYFYLSILTCPPKTGPNIMLGSDHHGGRHNAKKANIPGGNHPQTT